MGLCANLPEFDINSSGCDREKGIREEEKFE